MPFGLAEGILLAGIGAGAAGSIANSRSNRQQNEASLETTMEIARLNDERERALAAGDDQRARELAAQQDKLTRDLAAMEQEESRMNLALEESALDPFRHQNDQARSIGRLDMMELANLGPATFNAPSEMQQYVPQMSGGFSYEPSAEMRSSAGALKRDVMAGNTAPTMTNPKNYGKTGAIDILSVLGGGPARPDATALADDDGLAFTSTRQTVGTPDPMAPSYDSVLADETEGARGVAVNQRPYPYSNRSQWGGNERAMKDEPTAVGTGSSPFAGLGGAGGDLASLQKLIDLFKKKRDDEEPNDTRRVG